MLDNINSVYLLKIIFSYINEKDKLKIIKTNKSLQNKIGIALINYKIFSGRYIILEANNKGKEFNIYYDKMLFEGEYLNLKRNGKGKEYNIYGDIIYEGEYLNGKINGKGKEYDSCTGCILYDGEYINGEKNGKGKKYNDGGYLIFEGEFLNGKKWSGKGYEYNKVIYELKDGKGIIVESKYECEYSNGEKNGKGKEYDSHYKLRFEGEYLNGKWWNGKGYDQNENVSFEIKDGKGFIKEYEPIGGELKFEGEYINGERNGKGKEYSYDKLTFEGDFINGKRNGKGKEYNCNDFLEFEGEYLNGKKHGKCKEYDFDGQLIFEGEYLYGDKIKGKEYINGNLEYEGEYLLDRKFNGKGYDKNGNIIYELKNGNGTVKEYNNDRLIFEGEYSNGKRNGKGKEYQFYNSKNNLLFEGEYLNGKWWNGKGYDQNENVSFEIKDGKGLIKDMIIMVN